MMHKKLFIGLAVLSFIFICSNFAFAESVEDEVKELKARIAELERRLDGQQETVTVQRKEIDEIKEAGVLPQLEGIKIEAGATFVIQGTDDANGSSLSQKGEDATDASYSIGLGIEKEFEDYGKIGRAHV